ncbi:MAG: NUDIX domain-containing protein [Bacillota bacterium]
MKMETTYDGKPIAKERPYGAMIDVYRVDDGEAPFLVLYRAKHGPDYEGDWAWTPPCGARQAGETILKCAQRELWESVKQPRAAVVLVSDHGVALIRRVNESGEYYVFPGGGMEIGETPEEAAARETREELGVEVENGRWLAALLVAGLDRAPAEPLRCVEEPEPGRYGSE